ncbi:hypothetical protein IQ243_08035 [Nostocales cyanobacterium LEGE 11386]|nr:hypothetical protein [Nostocales cyanobacterium LEGE 11386]
MFRKFFNKKSSKTVSRCEILPELVEELDEYQQQLVSGSKGAIAELQENSPDLGILVMRTKFKPKIEDYKIYSY